VIGLGTIANTIAVIIGGGIGLFLKKRHKKISTRFTITGYGNSCFIHWHRWHTFSNACI
jgi:uncharacterized membrane protein YqgA involved in biofilm formation